MIYENKDFAGDLHRILWFRRKPIRAIAFQRQHRRVKGEPEKSTLGFFWGLRQFVIEAIWDSGDGASSCELNFAKSKVTDVVALRESLR